LCANASGFDLLLERADDLAVDTPKLADLLGRFLARAVADEALPPKYIMERAADPDLSPAAAAAVKEAQVLLNVKHGLARLSEIWGNDGGRRPVMQLSRKIDMIIQVWLHAPLSPLARGNGKKELKRPAVPCTSPLWMAGVPVVARPSRGAALPDRARRPALPPRAGLRRDRLRARRQRRPGTVRHP